MDKNFLQDVIPPTQKRSIRNIPLPKGRRGNPQHQSVKIKRPATEEIPEVKEERSKHLNKINFSTPPKKRKGRFLKLGFVLLSVFILMLIISVFSGSELEIYPKQADATVETSIAIENIDEKTGTDTLGFRLIEVTKEGSKTVNATSEEKVNEKASGTIVIENNYSSEPQKLVKNTRFESPNGNIYRIDESVTVPGKTDNSPGKIEAVVFADEAGEKFNIENTTFVIPGFEGLEQYELFSAKTKTSISGGFSGVRKNVNQEDLQNSVAEIKKSLENDLVALVNEQLSKEFTLLLKPNGASITFNEPKQTNQTDSSVDIILSGKIKAYVFSTLELSNHIAKNTLNDFNTENDILISNLSEITLSLSEENNTENIVVSGRAHFVWQTDKEKLKNDLAGTSRKDLKNTLQSFPSITKAKASVRPFWKRSFPNNPEKITILEVLE